MPFFYFDPKYMLAIAPAMLLAMDPSGGMPDLQGERTSDPAFGLPAMKMRPCVAHSAAGFPGG